MIVADLIAALSSAAPGAHVRVVDDEGDVLELVSAAVWSSDELEYTGVDATPGDVVLTIGESAPS
jgi:predicted methyltransferase